MRHERTDNSRDLPKKKGHPRGTETVFATFFLHQTTEICLHRRNGLSHTFEPCNLSFSDVDG